VVRGCWGRASSNPHIKATSRRIDTRNKHSNVVRIVGSSHRDCVLLLLYCIDWRCGLLHGRVLLTDNRGYLLCMTGVGVYPLVGTKRYSIHACRCS
jgi:hypothetical protein